MFYVNWTFEYESEDILGVTHNHFDCPVCEFQNSGTSLYSEPVENILFSCETCFASFVYKGFDTKEMKARICVVEPFDSIKWRLVYYRVNSEIKEHILNLVEKYIPKDYILNYDETKNEFMNFSPYESREVMLWIYNKHDKQHIPLEYIIEVKIDDLVMEYGFSLKSLLRLVDLNLSKVEKYLEKEFVLSLITDSHDITLKEELIRFINSRNDIHNFVVHNKVENKLKQLAYYGEFV